MAADELYEEKLVKEQAVSVRATCPGATLKTKREECGLSKREVADALRLTIDYVGMLEEGSYANLPGAIFVRGYIKAYAKLVDIPAEPLIAAYKEVVGAGFDEAEVESSESVTDKNTFKIKADHLRKVAYLVAVVFVVSLLFPADDAVDVADENSADSIKLEPSAIVVESLDKGLIKASQQERAEQEELTLLDDVISLSSLLSKDKVEVTSINNVIKVTSEGEDQLIMQFSDECWVEIADAHSGSLYNEMMKPGDQLEVVGQAPFDLKFGYAQAVQLSFNGEAVNLAPHTGIKVAKLVVGQ